MRVRLTTNICGGPNAGDVVDDARGAEWVARGLAVSEAAEVVSLAVESPLAPVALAVEASSVPAFFSPEPVPADVVPEVRSRRRR